MDPELSKQSQYSPSPVVSDEILLRIIYFPDHVFDNGKLKPEAIPTQDLKERGFSVQRKLYAKRKKIEGIIAASLEKKVERECRGFSPVICQIVRSIKDTDASQAFHVFDDANEKDDEAHAAIKFSQKYGKAYGKGLRNKLKDEFSVILPTDSVYEELNNREVANSSSNNIIYLLLKWIWAKLTKK